MKKLIIVLCIILTAGVLLGAVGIVAYAINEKNQTEDGNMITKKETYVPGEHLIVDCTTSEVRIGVADGEEIVFTYTENAKFQPTISHEDGTVTFRAPKIRDFISFGWFSRKTVVDITLPRNFSGDLTLKTTTGTVDARLDGLTVGKVNAHVTTGSLSLAGITATEVNATSTTGRLTLTDVSSVGDVTATCTTGHLTAERITSGDTMKLNTTTGSIRADEIQAATAFHAVMTTGRGEYHVTSPDIAIESTTGNIIFAASGAENLRLKSTTGDIRGTVDGTVTDYAVDYHTTTGESNLPRKTDGAKKLYAETTTGDITVTFSH